MLHHTVISASNIAVCCFNWLGIFCFVFCVLFVFLLLLQTDDLLISSLCQFVCHSDYNHRARHHIAVTPTVLCNEDLIFFSKICPFCTSLWVVISKQARPSFPSQNYTKVDAKGVTSGKVCYVGVWSSYASLFNLCYPFKYVENLHLEIAQLLFASSLE